MCLLVAIGGADVLKAPFPWFGGKSRAAHLIWAGIGDPVNYVEPFFGSGAALLLRPSEPKIETVNDRDMYLSNFWRATQHDPEGVARHADWPVNEADLHARHRWLVDQRGFRKKMRSNPDYYDVKIAGWWVWGVGMWIGGGFCAESNWRKSTRRARGVNTANEARRPNLHWGNGVHSRGTQTADQERRPHLMRNRGLHTRTLTEQLPSISGDSGASGRGIHATGRSNGTVLERMRALAVRLRNVRVCCGDWKRVLGRSSTESIGTTGILLDPPYLAEAGRDPSLYSTEGLTVARDVREWAIEHGKNPKLRIVLCGYEGEHEMPPEWECVAWKASGGYAAAAGNHENAHRERLWFSPACAEVRRQRELFESPTGRVVA